MSTPSVFEAFMYFQLNIELAGRIKIKLYHQFKKRVLCRFFQLKPSPHSRCDVDACEENER